MDKVIPNLQLFLILILISLMIFGLDSINFLKWPKIALYYLTNPITFGLYKTKQGFERQFYFIFAARLSAQENKALKEQLGELLSENAKLRNKLAEVEAQLSQQQSLNPQIFNLLVARPIGLSRHLKIDRGSNDKVKKNQAVVFKDNLIGQVTETSEKGANVKLLTDPDSKISAFSQGLSGKAKGVVTGQFGQEMLFDKILHEEKIQAGDLVYTEGLENFLPRGLVLGKVTRVEEKENEVFKKAILAPIFDIRDLELVFIIIE